MQQTPQIIPVMPSFPPTNITTEQIQKVFLLCILLLFNCFFFSAVLELETRVVEITVYEF